MRILWIHAHPEPASLTTALRDEGLDELDRQGHPWQLSDLYAMGWQPVLTARDVEPAGDVATAGGGAGGASGPCGPGGRLVVGRAQEEAYRAGRLAPEIRREQEKLAWADTVVVQFPLWWFGPPAILKGWFDRVFAQGYASAVRDADGRHRRYGDGGLAGRRVLTVTSVGARGSGFGPRGLHGHLDEVLFPLLHGTYWYTGMTPLRPFVVPGADRLDPAGYRGYADGLRARLRGIADEEPLRYRTERGGDYGPDLVLRPDVAPGGSGLGAHLAAPADGAAAPR